MMHHNETIRENVILSQDPTNLELMRLRPGRVISRPSHSSMTQQQYKDECNPNVVIQRYNRTGELGRIRQSQPIYVDCTSFDFEEARERVARIEETFMELPALLRRRFDHEPRKLLEFLQDEKNREEAIELGMIEKPIPTQAAEPPQKHHNDEEPAKAPKPKKKPQETPPEED